MPASSPVEIAYEGEVAKLNVKPLTAAGPGEIGVLRPLLAEINMVSAPAVAKETRRHRHRVAPGNLARL